MLPPALQLLEQLLCCCDSVNGNGGQVDGCYIYVNIFIYRPYALNSSLQDIYIYI